MELFKLLIKESILKTLYLFLISIIAGISGGVIIPLVINTAEQFTTGKSELQNMIFLPVIALLLIGTKRLSQQQIAFLVSRIQEKLILKITGNVRNAELNYIENCGRREDIYLKIVNAQVITNAATKNIETFQNIITIFICWLYIFILSHQMGLIFLFVFLIGVTVYELFQKLTEPFLNKETGTEKAMHRSFSHILDGFKEIKMNRRRSDDLFHNHLTPLVLETQKARTEGMLYFSDFHLFMVSGFFAVMGIYVFLFTSPYSYTILAKVLTMTLYITTPARAVIVSVPYILNGKVALNQLHRLAYKQDEQKSNEYIYNPDRESIKKFQTISLHNIRFVYNHKEGGQGFSVGPLSLTFNEGKICFITGGNGSGKSTLLKIITGLYQPDSGSFKIDDAVIRMAEHRYLFSAIFNDFHLFDELYGLDNIDSKRVRSLLEEMELTGKTQCNGRKFTNINLSNGQKKRLALIAMLLEDKPVLVFDEWAADQSPHFRKYFYKHLLPSFKAQGKTVIAVTHDDNYFHVADQIITMEYGEMIRET